MRQTFFKNVFFCLQRGHLRGKPSLRLRRGTKKLIIFSRHLQKNTHTHKTMAAKKQTDREIASSLKSFICLPPYTHTHTFSLSLSHHQISLSHTHTHVTHTHSLFSGLKDSELFMVMHLVDKTPCLSFSLLQFLLHKTLSVF